MKLKYYLKLMRPQQWFKSASVLFSAAVAFYQIGYTNLMIIKLLFAFIAISLLSSSIYVFNDISDVEKDRMHPIKRNRPIASNKIKMKDAFVFGIFIMLLSLLILFLLKPTLIFSGLFMLLLSSMYSFKPIRLKDKPILDIIVPALNFSLRVIIGWYAITDNTIDLALMLFPFFIASFLLSCKRYAEFLYLGKKAPKVRKVYSYYTKDNLDFMVNFNLIFSVLFYIFFSNVIDIKLIWLTPWLFVMFIWYRSFIGKGDNVVKKPEDVFVKKKLFTLNLILFCITWVLLLLI